MALHDVLARFPGARSTGSGWQVRCPAHEDRVASLAISEGGEGRVLVHCHAGCRLDAILSASGLTLKDLFPPSSNGNGSGNGSGTGPNVVTTYDYRNTAGELVYQVCRTEPKSFRQRRPDGSGGFLWNMQGVDRVLYRLPELRGHVRVFVVEGEKDADRLWSLGLPATTNVGGAGKWHDKYAKQLKDAGVQRVICLPDNDDPGREHSAAVVASCSKAGLLARSVALPDVLPKGDISDYLDMHTPADLEAILLEAAGTGESDPNDINLVGLDELLDRPVVPTRWLVEGLIPEGSVCLLVAKPKVGKTTAARCLAAAVARGEHWLGGECQTGLVWYIALEGRIDDHLSHFRQIGGTKEERARIRVYFESSRTDLLARLRARAERERPALVIVDTFGRLVGVDDLDDYAQVTRAFDPLIELCRSTNSTLLLLHHASKRTDAVDNMDTVLGSTAIAGSVDNLMMMAKLPGFRTISTRQRIGEDLDEKLVQFDKETGLVRLGEERGAADLRLITQKLYDVLAGNGTEPMSQHTWFEGVDARKQLKIRATRNLVTDGSVIRSGKGSRGSPYQYVVAVKNAAPAVPATEEQQELKDVEGF